MKSGYLASLLMSIIILAVSCGSNSQDPIQSNENSIPEYQLSMVDSFGVELGDSINMIGSINGFCYHPYGSILILDQAALRIRIISSDGEAKLISRQGEGPGELLLPQAICALRDGRILVSDQMKREVMTYDISGNYLGSYFTTDRYVPYRMFPIDSSSIVGAMLDLEMGEQILFSFYIGRFESDSTASVVYNSVQWEWPAAEMYTDIELMEFVANPQGNVFLVQDNTNYLISVYSPEGNEIYKIEHPDVNRIPKTSEEIEEEIIDFESWAKEDQAYTGGYEPSPYHHLISLAGVDEEGNLWIERHDSDDGYKFDIWDATGNLFFTATFPAIENDPEFHFSVDQHGILAAIVDSEHFPQVYKLRIEKPVGNN